MALEVGTDSYISLEDATTYISTHYLASEITTWTALTDGDKEILLRRAAKKIDRQPLQGVKVIETQLMEFPRALYSDYEKQYIDMLAVPDNVKYAQVEEALYMGNSKNSARIDLQMQGVKSITTGKASETYVGITGESTEQIYSLAAKQLLSPYLARAVQIC